MSDRTVALYMRLSREDDKDMEKDESNSIRNQRKLLLGFLKKRQEFTDSSILQYVDDGYSGIGFQRPGFEEMMDGVKKGRIQCVIVKDFSRFGRDYIELGDYIEHIFPFMQVRFISVNDGYDSREYQGVTPDIDVPFRNLAYSLYSQDISDKIKSSLAVRRKKGQYIGSAPLYGYRRSQEGFLTPDGETEATVKRIYREYLSGTGLTELAGKLNAEGIPSPKQHKINTGILHGEQGKSYFWIPATIRQILCNETYTGVLSSGAYKNGPLGSGERIYVPKEERVRVENAHPPIIDRDIFREVQKKMRTKRNGEAQQFLLKGFVRCGECGQLMDRDKARFRCRYQKFTAHRKVESFAEAELEEVVWKVADIMLQLSGDKEAVFQKETELCKVRQKQLHTEIKGKRLQLEKKREEIRRLYHRYRQGKTEKTDYLKRKEQKGIASAAMEAELAGLEAEEERLRQRRMKAEAGSVTLAEWLECRGDRRQLLQVLIESVDMYPGKRIEIRWKFS